MEQSLYESKRDMWRGRHRAVVREAAAVLRAGDFQQF